jgi:hypothetical protein
MRIMKARISIYIGALLVGGLLFLQFFPVIPGFRLSWGSVDKVIPQNTGLNCVALGGSEVPTRGWPINYHYRVVPPTVDCTIPLERTSYAGVAIDGFVGLVLVVIIVVVAKRLGRKF